MRLNRFQGPYNEKSFKKIKRFEESSKSRGVFRTHASIYDGAFMWMYLTALYFCSISSIIVPSTGLYIGLWKYWDFQSEVKVEQIIAIVTTHSVCCYFSEGNILRNIFWKCTRDKYNIEAWTTLVIFALFLFSHFLYGPYEFK